MEIVKKQLPLLLISLLLAIAASLAQSQNPADWMRGTWGLNWKPGVGTHVMRTTKVEDFLDQIEGMRTVDYIQLHMNGSGIQTPFHAAPHPVLEALHSTEWDSALENAMIVPPASDGDNFLAWLKAIKAAGYRTQVYLNGANIMKRHVKKAPCTHLPQYDHPASIPSISEVWKRYCDANFQEFIDSKTTHTEQYFESAVVQQGDTTGHPDRKYAFCYAEYVIKTYSERYGTLIDAWLFDGARNIEGQTGDEPLLYPGDPSHLEAYKAFADAARAGNPDAVVCFNNGLGADDAVNNPYHAILYDDYTMGHPFNGGNEIGDKSGSPPTHYDQNFHLCTWIADHDGYVFADGPSWAQNIVGHWDPPMSDDRWNAGDTPALSNEDFNLWNLTTLQGNGAVSWGLPIDENHPLINDWAFAQLSQGDTYLSIHQSPGAPNWARHATLLPEAFVGQAYYHALTEEVDFWDPEEAGVTSLIAIGDSLPAWLHIFRSERDPDQWILSGIPTETTTHIFTLRATDVDGSGDRDVKLNILDNPVSFSDPGDGSPVWFDSLKLADATEFEHYSTTLVQGRDFYDFEGDTLTITRSGGASWLNIEPLAKGIWQLRGYPTEEEVGYHTLSLSLSDGSHTTLTDLKLFVNAATDYRSVQIRAAPQTNYGIDSVATMISGVHTAPDGLAMFQVSIDVTPPPGKAIISGISGGDATANSWGIGDGTDPKQDAIFRGSDGEWVESISNIRIVSFNANGGELSLADFRSISFDSVTVVNAQTGDRDAVAFAVNGDTTDLGTGGINHKTETVSLEYITGSDNITDFTIGVGESQQQSINKWSVEGIGVKYDMGIFHTLNITKEHGKVVSDPGQTGFRHNTEVKLVAVPDTGYRFDGWSGDTTGDSVIGDTIIVEMDANKEITATFSILTYSLQITAENGSVVKSPEEDAYDHGTKVQLVAFPEPGYRFDGWSGDTSSTKITGDTLVLVMDGERNITAVFSPVSGTLQSETALSCAIYPNPSDGIFHVHFPQEVWRTYLVYSIKGDLVRKGMSEGSFELDLGTYKKGIYLLHIQTVTGVVMKKLILY